MNTSITERAEELWDKYSYLIEDNSDSFGMVAGSCVIDRQDFMKLIEELSISPLTDTNVGHIPQDCKEKKENN